MTDNDDLRQFLDGSPTAFTRIVERHVDLVYSVARRHLASAPHLAEDTTQAVFAELARKARRIPANVPLVGWLHVVSRRVALNMARTESRRRAREEQAAQLAEPASSLGAQPSSDWPAIEPLIDEAVEALALADRTAILLRFFERKSLREVGVALGTSDDAAQKRVMRALETLRGFFLQRGVTISSAGLATGISAHAVQVAPAALSALVSSTAVVATILTGPLLIVTTLQKTLAVAAAIAVGGALFYANQISRQRTALAERSAARAVLERELSDRRRALADVRGRAAGVMTVVVPRASAMAAPSDPAMEAEMDAWFRRIADLRRLAEQRPDLTIPEMKLLGDEDWHSVADGEGGQLEPEKLLSRLRMRAKNIFGNSLQTALNAYIASRGGELPRTLADLGPFLREPVDPAMLARYAVMQQGKLADVANRDRAPVIIERPSDRDDAHLGISTQGFSFGPFNLREHTARALRSHAAANASSSAPSAAGLLPYFDPPLTPGLQEKFLKEPERFLPR